MLNLLWRSLRWMWFSSLSIWSFTTEVDSQNIRQYCRFRKARHFPSLSYWFIKYHTIVRFSSQKCIVHLFVQRVKIPAVYMSKECPVPLPIFRGSSHPVIQDVLQVMGCRPAVLSIWRCGPHDLIDQRWDLGASFDFHTQIFWASWL